MQKTLVALAVVLLTSLAALAQSPVSRVPDALWPRWSPGQTSWVSEGLQQPDPGGTYHGLAVSADGMSLLHMTSLFPRRGATGESNLADAELVWASPGAGGGYGAILGGQCVVADNGDIHAYFLAEQLATDLNGVTVPVARLHYVKKPWTLPWLAPVTASDLLIASTGSRESVRELAVSQDAGVVTCWYEQEERTAALTGGSWVTTKLVTKLWKHTAGGATAIDPGGFEHDPAMSVPMLAAHRNRVARVLTPYGVAAMRLYYHTGTTATQVRSVTTALALGPAGFYLPSDNVPRFTWLEASGALMNVRHVSGTTGSSGETWGIGTGGAVYPDANGILHRFWMASGELRHSIRSGTTWTTPAVSATAGAGMRTLGVDPRGQWVVVDGTHNGDGTQTWAWDDNLGMQDPPTMVPTAPNTWTNVANGNLFHKVPLFATAGECVMPEMTLFYNSLDRNEGVLGQGWRHSYSIAVHTCSAGLLLTLPEGHRIVCVWDAASSAWIPKDESGVSLKITDLGGTGGVQWRLETAGGVFWNFNALGKPVARQDRDGNTLTLTYSGAPKNLLTSVNGGCKLVTLTYDAQDRIFEIIDPAGTRYEMVYDNANDTLVGIRFKDALGVVLREWGYGYFAASGPVVPLPDGVVLPGGVTEFGGVKGVLSTIRTPKQVDEAPTSTLRNFLFSYLPTGEFVGRQRLSYDPEIVYGGIPSRKLVRVEYSATPEVLSGATGFTSTVTDREGKIYLILAEYARNLALRIIDPENGAGAPTLRTFDGRRNLLTFTDPGGRTTTYTYITPAEGLAPWVRDLVKTIQLPGDSAVTTIAYNPLWNLPSSVTPVTGASDAVTYLYDGEGHLEEMQLPGDPGPYTWTYDATGRVKQAMDPVGSFSSYVYTSCCDGPTEVTHSGVEFPTGGSAPTTIGYNPMGFTVSTTCPPGGNYTTTWNALHQPIEQKAPPNANPAVTVLTWDKDGNFVARLDPNGNQVTLTRNDVGRVTAIQNPDLSTASLDWTPNGWLAGMTNFNGQTMTATYDAIGRMETRSVQVDHTIGLYREWSGTYDGSNNLLTSTVQGTGGNPAAQMTTYTISPKNLVSSILLPDLETEIRLAYNARRSVVSRETWWKPSGAPSFAFYAGTGYVLDAQQRATKVVEMDQPLPGSGIPTGRETMLGYTGAGQVSTVTPPRGFTWTQLYDTANRDWKTIDPTGVESETKYDARSLPTDTYLQVPGHGRQSPMTAAWNCRHELVSVHDNVNPTLLTTFTYDPGGRLDTITGPLGLSVQKEYNALDDESATVVQKAVGTLLRYETGHNNVSEVTSTTAPPGASGGGPAWQYGRNRDGMLTSTTSPLGHAKTITRNALGLPTYIVDEDGNTTTHTYNARNWPLVSTYRFPGGALREEITRTYDAVGNVLTIESATTGIREEFRYAPITGPDPHTLTLREVIWKRSGVFWKAVEYDTDPNGNVIATRIREASGTITHTVVQGYDDSDRLGTITINGVQMAVLEYEHGFHVKTTFPQTGNVILRYYRENGRLRAIAHVSAAGQVLAQVEYTEDARDRREEVFHAHLDVKSTYTYTDNSWLETEQHVGPAGGPSWTNTEAAQPGGNAAAPTTGAAVTPNPSGATVNHQRANTYSLRGNRELVTGPGWNQVMQYDGEDRLMFEQRNGQPIQYTYENRGCLATKNAAGQLTTFENDYLGRMIGYQTATAHVRDTYAPTGQRVAHVDQLGVAPEEWYLPDGLETLADYTKQGANPEQFDGIYAATGLDGKAARVNAAGQATYFFQDALGSVGQVIDQSGAVVRTNFTDAWGAPLAVGLPAPPVGLAGRWGYTGRERDDVSGLMHYRARTYDPATGRFTGRDPVWASNLYLYVDSDPANWVDPAGMKKAGSAREAFGMVFSHFWGETKKVGAGVKSVAVGYYHQQLDRIDRQPDPIRKAVEGARIGVEHGVIVVPAAQATRPLSTVAQAGRGAMTAARASRPLSTAGSMTRGTPGRAARTPACPPPVGPAPGGTVAAKGGSALRQQYVDAVTELGGQVPGMRQGGMSSEEIARALYAERRALGIKFKDLTPADELAKIHVRNLERYGDALGPSIEWLRNAGKSWEDIIESATRSGGRDLGY